MTDPAELAALIHAVEAIVAGEFMAPSNAVMLYEQRDRILAALTQARADREEVEWLKREMTAAAQLKDEMARLFHLACDQRDKAEAENEALAKGLAEIYEWYDRDGSVGGAVDPFEDNRALLATRTAAAKEGT